MTDRDLEKRTLTIIRKVCTWIPADMAGLAAWCNGRVGYSDGWHELLKTKGIGRASMRALVRVLDRDGYDVTGGLALLGDVAAQERRERRSREIAERRKSETGTSQG